MKRPSFRYDPANMAPLELGAKKALDRAKERLLEDWKDGSQGWLGSPDDDKLAARCSSLAASKKNFTTCLVVGIGGSDLGARAVWHALHDARSGAMRLEFAGGNTDPDELEATLKRIDLKTTLVNVISKSGDTVEPMAAFLLIRERLIGAVGRTKFADHIVATTDERGGSLLDLARREGYATLSVPENIGGRFSALTAVGLFPMACAGFDIKAMLRGAKYIRDAFVDEAPSKNAPTQFAALHVLGDEKHGLKIHVLMPYSERLRKFAAWYRQLWAESLGKDGRGPTPIAALGATDQHSQIQLYADGPKDKIVTFIDVEAFDSRVSVPATAKTIAALSYLSGKPFGEILHAERAATAKALAEKGRPNGTMFIPRVDEASLGGLFLFFEIACGIAGELYGINAYDQPGVEAGKLAMVDILKKKK